MGSWAQKHGLSDLMPQEPDVSEEGRLAALAGEWIWFSGIGYYSFIWEGEVVLEQEGMRRRREWEGPAGMGNHQ